MSKADLISTPLWQLRSVQNWVKNILIKEVCPLNDSKVVQIGGCGLDIGKW